MDSRVDHHSWLRVALAVFAVGWGANQFAPLLYLYRTAQGLSQSEVTAMFSVYVVGLLPALLVAGRWSDRNEIGRASCREGAESGDVARAVARHIAVALRAECQ